MNLDIKRKTIDCNMKLNDLVKFHKKFPKITYWSDVNTDQKQISNHDEYRLYQKRMSEICTIHFLKLNVLNFDADILYDKIKDKDIFFNISNIFIYNANKASHSFQELIEAYEKLQRVLKTSNSCWLRGKPPVGGFINSLL